MDRQQFGPTRREVALIGQGTWYNPGDDRAAAVAALRAGLGAASTSAKACADRMAKAGTMGTRKRS